MCTRRTSDRPSGAVRVKGLRLYLRASNLIERVRLSPSSGLKDLVPRIRHDEESGLPGPPVRSRGDEPGWVGDDLRVQPRLDSVGPFVHVVRPLPRLLLRLLKDGPLPDTPSSPVNHRASSVSTRGWGKSWVLRHVPSRDPYSVGGREAGGAGAEWNDGLRCLSSRAGAFRRDPRRCPGRRESSPHRVR